MWQGTKPITHGKLCQLQLEQQVLPTRGNNVRACSAALLVCIQGQSTPQAMIKSCVQRRVAHAAQGFAQPSLLRTSTSAHPTHTCQKSPHTKHDHLSISQPDTHHNPRKHQIRFNGLLKHCAECPSPCSHGSIPQGLPDHTQQPSRVRHACTCNPLRPGHRAKPVAENGSPTAHRNMWLLCQALPVRTQKDWVLKKTTGAPAAEPHTRANAHPNTLLFRLRPKVQHMLTHRLSNGVPVYHHASGRPLEENNPTRNSAK